MNRTSLVLCVSLASTLLAAGCRKTSFGAGCEKSAELGAPWTDLALPIEEDKTRVCSSSPEELKLRSYSWTSASEAQPAFEKVMLAAGYTKDRCAAAACYYDKAGFTVSVHPIEFKVKSKNLVTVVMSRKPDPRQMR
ncbi:MAG TPA: hypothetical protein VK698_10445 [Kofleriaceae bacterium]|nr:hypothetical protein [Kofleriaceae bacterium]